MEQIIIEIFSDLYSKNSKDIKSDCREIYHLSFTADKLTDILEKNKSIFQSGDLKVINDIGRINILKELDVALLKLIKSYSSSEKSNSEIKNDIISLYGLILEDEQLNYYLNIINCKKDYNYSIRSIILKIFNYVNFKNYQHLINYNDFLEECKNFKLNFSEKTILNILMNDSYPYTQQAYLTYVFKLLNIELGVIDDTRKDISEEIDTLFYNLIKTTIDSNKDLNIKSIQKIITDSYDLKLEDDQISSYLDKIKQNDTFDKSLLRLLITDPNNITSTTIENISKSLDLDKIRVATKLANIGYKFKLRNSDFKIIPTTKKDIEDHIDGIIRDRVQDDINPEILIELCNEKIKLSNGTEEDFNYLSDKYFCKYMEIEAKLDGKDVNHKVKNLENISKNTGIELLSLIMFLAN